MKKLIRTFLLLKNRKLNKIQRLHAWLATRFYIHKFYIARFSGPSVCPFAIYTVCPHLVSILIHRCLSSFVLALSIRPRRTLCFTGHVQSLKTPSLRPMRRNMCDFLLRPCWRRVRGFAPWFPGRRSCLRAPFPSLSPICPRLWPICPTKARTPRSFSPRPSICWRVPEW